MKSRRQTGRGGAAVDGNTSTGGGSKMERKDVEKNRRLHMKGLCLKLSSLVPPTSTHHIRHYPSNSNPSPSNNSKVFLIHFFRSALVVPLRIPADSQESSSFPLAQLLSCQVQNCSLLLVLNY